MARKVRLEYAGACYHVINRGNYRRDLFGGEREAAAFQTCVLEAAQRFGWRLHAFVVMRNHFHLAVETPEPNLSEGMKWLQGTWAVRFNRFRGEAGRPFQGRYKALHVEPGAALAQVAHYIHLNPVRAKVVPAEQVASYRWSSLPLFAGRKRPDCLEAGTVLGECGGLKDTPAGWRRYVEYLGLLAEEELAMRAARFSRLSRGWMIGSGEFKAGLREELMQRGADLERMQLIGADRDAQRELRGQCWEEKLVAAACVLGIALDRLPDRKSAQEKVRLAALMKMGTSVSNGWLAERLKMGQPASVSQYVRRFRLDGHTAKTEFQRGLSIFKT